jgi:hypothetical protein
MDRIRSGPTELVLDRALPRFRRRTCFNPCDFSDFLRALQTSETIRNAACVSHLDLGITEDEWVLLVKTLGSMKCIDHLQVRCAACFRDFCPFQAVAGAVKNAYSLRALGIGLAGTGTTFPRDQSGMIALANTLREHTSLREFTCDDLRDQPVAQDLSLDFVLRALPACFHLRKVLILTRCASADAV